VLFSRWRSDGLRERRKAVIVLSSCLTACLLRQLCLKVSEELNGTYDMQGSISFSIDHLQFFTRRIACQYLNHFIFLVAPSVLRHPVSQWRQGTGCLVTALEKHLLECGFVEELEKPLDLFGLCSSSTVSLTHEHAVSHVPSCLIPRTLVCTDRDEIGGHVFAVGINCEMERRPAF
jgi:hypothetical protein